MVFPMATAGMDKLQQAPWQVLASPYTKCGTFHNVCTFLNEEGYLLPINARGTVGTASSSSMLICRLDLKEKIVGTGKETVPGIYGSKQSKGIARG